MATKSGCIWLIDAAYVWKGHPTSIDYIKLRNTLQAWACPDQHFDQIIFYNSIVEDGKTDLFYDFLKSHGFMVKLFPLKRSGDRVVQRGVDVAICTDLLILAYEGKFKRVLLTCGDGDLIAAVQAVRNRFQEVYLSGYRNSMSTDLLKEANAIYWM